MFPMVLQLKCLPALSEKSKYVEYLTTAGNVSVKTDYLKYHIDGDPVMTDGNSTLSIIKGNLNVS